MKVYPKRGILFAEPVTGVGGWLVTLDCGHKKATREQLVEYECRECPPRSEGGDHGPCSHTAEEHEAMQQPRGRPQDRGGVALKTFLLTVAVYDGNARAQRLRNLVEDGGSPADAFVRMRRRYRDKGPPVDNQSYDNAVLVNAWELTNDERKALEG